MRAGDKAVPCLYGSTTIVTDSVTFPNSSLSGERLSRFRCRRHCDRKGAKEAGTARARKTGPRGRERTEGSYETTKLMNH